MAKSSPSLAPIASVVQRLAVLLAAGVTPASAWGYLAESQTHRPSQPQVEGQLPAEGQPQEEGQSHGTGFARQDHHWRTPGRRNSMGQRLSAVADRSMREPIGEVILVELATAPEDVAWRGLAAAWMVATDAGAPLASTLRDFAESLRDLARIQRELKVAIAGPAATAKMVLVLPIVGLVFGVALGFDTLGILVTTVPGALCFILGIALMVTARVWNARLLRSATPKNLTPGLRLDLLAIAVSGGASIDRAKLAVSSACTRCELKDLDAEAIIDEALELSRRAGVPAAALLRSEAELVRTNVRNDAEEKAARLAVAMMLPLGLCILPAFMVLGVAPLMIAVISSTAITL